MAGEQRPLAGAIQTVVGALIVVVTLAIYVPVAPLFPSINLDGGWAFALNVAVERGLVFGRDLVFTFGPYGAAYTQLYYPATDTMMLASTALLGTAFAFGLLCISQGWRERLGALLLVLLMAAIARDSLFFALPFMLLLLTCRVAMRQGKSGGGPERIEVTPFVCLSLALLVVALSLIPLVKGTFAGATGMVMALSCVLLLLRGHKALAMAGAVLFAVSMPLLWVLVGQPLAALPEFFISQAPIVSGYTDAMSSPGGLLLPAFFILSSLTLVALHARARGLAHATLILGTTGLLFIAFKGGFVRPDSHILMSGGMIAIAASLLALGQAGVRGKIGAAVGLACWAVLDMSATSISLLELPTRIKTPVVAAANMLVARLENADTLTRL